MELKAEDPVSVADGFFNVAVELGVNIDRQFSNFDPFTRADPVVMQALKPTSIPAQVTHLIKMAGIKESKRH